ncbi:MAG: TonB-dependent receptor [Cellulophaga sp.]
MIRLILSTLLMLSFFLAEGSETEIIRTITGTIIDKETKEPLAYATVSIFKQGKVVDGIITNEDGKFSISAQTGEYLLKAEYLSYITYERQVTLKKDIDLGAIFMEVDTQALNEVVVVSDKSTVELKLDKKVFNVGKDILAQNGSLSQVLDNVPSVSVDIDGGVSLRGNSNVSILINGKPSVLVANNGLDQISAKNIDRVEIITNPSSRYQAAGTAGIINVILKKNKEGGLSGSVSVGVSSPADTKINVNLNYKTDKFNFFSTIAYRDITINMEQQVAQTSGVGLNSIHLDQNVTAKRNYDLGSLYIGMDYFINDKNRLTATYYKTLVNNNFTSDFIYDYYNGTNNLDSTVVRIEDYKEPMDHNQLELSYEKTFAAKGKKLTIDFQYDFWDDDENESLETQKITPVIGAIAESRTRDIESSKDYLFQLDFVNPFNDKSTFETGIRGESRIITSDYKVEEFVSGAWEIFNGIENSLDYKEKIGGVYTQFSSKINKVSYQLGLRAELTEVTIVDQKNTFSNIKNYTNIFPTAHITYAFEEGTSLQLSYSKRINRPSFWHLNPFGGLAELNVQRQGNPDMDPALTNSYELGFIMRLGKLRINPSVYFQNTVDFFSFYTERNSAGILITKPINLDNENRVGFELSTSYNPFKWMRLNGTFNYFSFEQRGNFKEVNYDFEDSYWFTRVSSRIKLPSEITMQTSFNYRAERENAQSVTKSRYFVDLGLSKNLWGNKATVSFNIQDVFNSREERLVRTGKDFSYTSSRRRIGPKYTLNFLYRFNQKSNTKNRRPGESNR